MLTDLVKAVAYSIAPKATFAVCSARARAYSHKLVKEWGLFDINQRLIQELGSSVIAGPFKGLRLTPMTHQEHIGPYLLGTYESELHPWWERVSGREFKQIVDIGSSFGYYCVGLARRFPNATVTAFDTDAWARRAVSEMVLANGVSNVAIESYCSALWLRHHLREDALLVSDCEGYERALLCDAENPALKTATMIVELHESLSPGVSSAVVERFSSSHLIEEVGSRAETPFPTARISSLTDDEIRRASAEVRPHQTWLFLCPRPS